MTRCSIARLTSSGSSGAAALEIIAPTLYGFWLRGLQIALSAATASVYGLGRPAAKGITPTTPVALLLNGAVGTLGQVLTATALAWGTGPTVPVSFFRQVGLPATVGANAFLIDPSVPSDSIWVPANGSLVLWNGAANSVAYVSVTVDEMTA